MRPKPSWVGVQSLAAVVGDVQQLAGRDAGHTRLTLEAG